MQKNNLIKILAVTLLCSVSAQFAAAGCSKQTISGNFAGEALFPENEFNWSSNLSLMILPINSGHIVKRHLIPQTLLG